MIKKSTKITFEESGETIEDTGGIPLSEGEVISMDGSEYVVARKSVACYKAGEDWMAEVEYVLQKK